MAKKKITRKQYKKAYELLRFYLDRGDAVVNTTDLGWSTYYNLADQGIRVAGVNFTHPSWPRVKKDKK